MTAYSTYRLLVHATNPSNPRAVCIQEMVLANAAGGATICAGGTASASSIDSAPYAAASAFDGTSSFWASSVAPPPDQWLQYTFPAPVSPAELRIVGRPDGYATITGPTVFDLLGSNDGAQFTVIKSYVSGIWDGTPNQSQAFAIPAPAARAARYWRINIAAIPGDYIEIQQLQFVAGGVNLATVAARFSVSSAYYSNYNLVDTTVQAWIGSTPNTPQTVAYDFGSPVAIDTVNMLGVVNFTYASRNPKSFTVEYSDDNATWTPVAAFYPAALTKASQQQTFALYPVISNVPTKVLVGQSQLEILGASRPGVMVAQSSLEVLGQTRPAALVSQSFVEVLFRPASNTPGPRPRRVFVAMT